MFPKDIQEALDKLVFRYKSTKRIVEAKYPIIELKFYEKMRAVAIQLFFIDGSLEIQEPTYLFIPKISHYDYKVRENRISRDQRCLFGFINDLKYCGLWEYVSNKDFIEVNQNNQITDKKMLANKLDKLLSE